MDAARALQLLTDLAYLALGIAAVAAALRSHERARLDVAILFGALAITVGIQEIQLLSCASAVGCLSVPLSNQLSTILVLVLPYALLRLLDDVADMPRWQMYLALGLLITLAAGVVMAGPTLAGWLVLFLIAYLVTGVAYAAWAFARRALSTMGITRRRMAAVAWGCGFMAAAIVLAVAAASAPRDDPLLTLLGRLSGLTSGLCFWAGFFPPHWLSRAWRLPELVGYLRPTRLMAVPDDQQGVATDAMALERLCAATAATTGARRVLLLLEDAAREDLYLWGAPSARVGQDDPLIARVLRTREPLVVSGVTPDQLPEAVVSVFGTETLPRTAMLVPIALAGRHVGILAAFAEKGPMFVEDDLEVVSFFASEAAAVLRMQRYRQSANELEALREADKLKDEFMAVVSHELRTPLTAISGYSDILLRKLSGPLNDRQERQVVGVRDASRRLLALINDLLDVSKLEAGTLDLRLTPLDPRNVVERAAAGVRVIGTAKGVSVQVRETVGDIPVLRADEERLQQILTNLLINAIKFTPEGGAVWISAGEQTGATGPEVVFRVEDTGVGLAPSQLARVWERFYQAESSATRRFGGAGLGLSIVRRLAELHGGRVEVASAGVGRGSTFAVYLPAAAAGEKPQSIAPVAPSPAHAGPPQPPPPNAAAPLVLVVEDDVHVSTVLRTYLEADGYRVEVVMDGQEAIQAARELLPFAITLDISLPKLDGWSVLNALKRESTTADIPVVIVSIVDNRDFGLVLGATDYLVKPIDHERLRNALRGLVTPGSPDDGSVLIVDDDAALREVLSCLLAEDGWRVATAADGEAALAAVEQHKPSAVVLDLMMPRVDGFEVLQTLRRRPSTQDLPVIVVTAKDLTDEDRERLARNAQRVIIKQAVPLEELREEIRGILTRRTHNGVATRGEAQQ
ncbi:MAG: response regulator [Chloroflexi bacterium]|nr:MAG: response regulator [Chloroflexota bacterium]